MSVSLLPLCSIPKLASRDGLSGAAAHIILPFYEFGSGATAGGGFYFFSGQQYLFPQGYAAQDQSVAIRGNSQINTYTKDCCDCLGQGGNNGITYVAP